MHGECHSKTVVTTTEKSSCLKISATGVIAEQDISALLVMLAGLAVVLQPASLHHKVDFFKSCTYQVTSDLSHLSRRTISKRKSPLQLTFCRQSFVLILQKYVLQADLGANLNAAASAAE